MWQKDGRPNLKKNIWSYVCMCGGGVVLLVCQSLDLCWSVGEFMRVQINRFVEEMQDCKLKYCSPCISLQVANQTLHTDRPDLPECFQLTVLSWLPCIYLWVVCPIYLFCLKRNNRGYIMMSIMNRFKTVRGDCSVVYFITSYSKAKPNINLKSVFNSVEILNQIYKKNKQNKA